MTNTLNVYKVLTQISKKKTEPKAKNQRERMAKDLNKQFTKEYSNGQ